MDKHKPANVTSVRLTRKFAEAIDGVDLSQNKVGDRLDLSFNDAGILIAEGWAMPCSSEPKASANEASSPKRPDEHRMRAKANDSSRVRRS